MSINIICNDCGNESIDYFFWDEELESLVCEDCGEDVRLYVEYSKHRISTTERINEI